MKDFEIYFDDTLIKTLLEFNYSITKIIESGKRKKLQFDWDIEYRRQKIYLHVHFMIKTTEIFLDSASLVLSKKELLIFIKMQKGKSTRMLYLKDCLPIVKRIYKDIFKYLEKVGEPSQLYSIFICRECGWLYIDDSENGMCLKCYEASLNDFKKKIPHTQIDAFNDFLISLGFKGEQLNRLDYVHHKKKIAIEVDGAGHYDNKTIDKDKLKDREAFLKHGVTVLRYPKKLLLENMQEIIKEIEEVINKE